MASLSLEESREQLFTHSIGLSVEEASRLRSGTYSKSKEGSFLKSGDAAWYMFDDLSCTQAEDLLHQHGNHGTYLVAHFHEPESYGISIKHDDGTDNIYYKHYAIGTSKHLFHTEGIAGDFPSIEEVIEAIGLRLSLKLVPIFHKFNEDTSDFEITMTQEEDEKPPEYSQASRFPDAARKPLPLIIPVHPTLRRMMRQQQQYSGEESGGPEIIDSAMSDSSTPPRHGCCWKAFHTDADGKWYKPHKAGPITACLLVVGWVLFLVLFGWIVGLALLLVLLLLACACLYNYICTGRCEVEEAEEGEGVGQGGGQEAAAVAGGGTAFSSQYNGMQQQ